MSRPWIFISPSSRGIGHALTRHLLRTTTLPILATSRTNQDAVKASLLADLPLPSNITTSTSTSSTPPSSFSQEDRLHVLPLDVTDEASIRAAAQRAAELFPPSAQQQQNTAKHNDNYERYHLHLAFAIPGILHPERAPKQVDAEDALMTYRVNTLGPLLLMKWFGEFLPRKNTAIDTSSIVRSDEGNAKTTSSPEQNDETTIPSHATWLTMSARVGSVSDNRKGGWYSYRSSKAAVNSLAKSFDLHLATKSGDKAMSIAYHPGTVKTDFSKEFWGSMAKQQLLDSDYAAAKMVEVVTQKVGLEGRGRCWDWKGEEILP
ncbi:oxidoreductase [Coniella lustricola]|uniref:Oxidoreductase n=1 Tax=Coniella lustricola TaxID=2025994 RepID=A0A2T3ALL0_9PEZI|nr:oxidoreductase [Coniella lustricola]